MATTTGATAGVSRKTAEVKETTLVGEVFTWTAWPRNPGLNRDYIQITMPYEQFRWYFFVQPYVDTKGEGWQRHQAEPHVNALAKAMATNTYSVSCFMGGLLPSHRQRLRIEEDPQRGIRIAHVDVSSKFKLACTDGGHRERALHREMERAVKSGDREEARRILDQPISMILTLDCDKHVLVADFLNYQKGKVMDRNLASSLALRHNIGDPRKAAGLQFCKDVCRILVEDSRSHLFNQVAFDASGSGRLNWKALSMETSSNTGCSIWGGSLIAKHHALDEAWLAARYVEAYRALADRTEREPGTNLPAIFLPGKALTPHGVREGGSKGASAFVLGMGNLLAWRLAFLGQPAASEDDLDRIATLADDLFDRSGFGWSATDKRLHLGQWARAYFADLLASPGQKPHPARPEGFSGIPRPLLRLLKPSTFLIPREEAQQFRKEDAQNAQDYLQEQEQVDAAPAPAPKSTGRRR